MNPTYYDIMMALAVAGFGTAGVTLFGGEWGGVDSQVLVLDGPGFSSELKDQYESPGFQVLVRGPKSGAPDSRDIDVYRRAKSISDYLLALPETFEANGACYKGIEETSNIAPLGKDANERFVYSMNFITWRNR